MKRNGRKLLGVFAAIALWSFSAPGTAQVRASVDRDQVQLNESFGFVLEVDSSTSAQPDFSDLRRDFEILSESKRSNVSITNNEYKASTSWNLDLIAKRAGELVIPAIPVGGESSEPIEITVTPVAPGAPQNADLFLEISVDPREAYVQQQILVSLRVFLAVNPIDLRLTPLSVSGGDTVIEQMDGDVEFGTTRGTKRYRVIERNYLVFPQQSGALTIEPATLEARVSQPGFGTFSRSSLLRSRTDAIDVEIKPIPAAFTGQTWLPAKKLEIEESWSQTPPAFRVGEPSTRTLRLRAGGLTATQLPELAPYMPDDLKHYADQPELNDTKSRTGVLGNRTERYAIIPTVGGDFILPPVEIPWWNTETDALEVAVLGARTIQIDGGSHAARDSEPTPSADEADMPSTRAAEADSGPWVWVSAGLALGWLLTVLAWLLKGRGTAKRPGIDAAPDSKSARTSLARACKANAPHEAKDALLEWSSTTWPRHPARSLGDIANRAGGAFGTQAKRLSEALYGKHFAAWEGEPLWRAFKAYDAGRIESDPAAPEVLPPLYRT